MSGGADIKMLATVSESTYTRLYRELAALPERKRVKRLIVLAQIGQIAEMAAMGHQLLPAYDLPSSAAAPAIAASTATVGAAQVKPASLSQAPAEPVELLAQETTHSSPAVDAPIGVLVSQEGHVTDTNPPTGLQPLTNSVPSPAQGEQAQTARKPRRKAHSFKVDMT